MKKVMVYASSLMLAFGNAFAESVFILTPIAIVTIVTLVLLLVKNKQLAVVKAEKLKTKQVHFSANALAQPA